MGCGDSVLETCGQSCRLSVGLSNAACSFSSDVLRRHLKIVDDRGRDTSYLVPPGGGGRSPAPRLPQNVACRFPALRSSEGASQRGDSLQLRVREIQLWSQQRKPLLNLLELLSPDLPLPTPAAQHLAPVTFQLLLTASPCSLRRHGAKSEPTGAVPQHVSATNDGNRVSNRLPQEKHESEETPLRENASSNRVFQHQLAITLIERF
jgi:hypothetical protein